jgi:hypothetical protein
MTDSPDESSTKFVHDFINGIRTAFDRDPDAPPLIENERVRVAEALFAVHDFIAKFPELGPRYAKPFGDLGQKIADINMGAVDVLFGRPRGTPRRDTSAVWCARANLVFAVNALIAASGDKKEIADAVAEVIGWHRSVSGSSEEMKGRLTTWRKEFSAGRTNNDSANELYNLGCELIRAYAADPNIPGQGGIKSPRCVCLGFNYTKRASKFSSKQRGDSHASTSQDHGPVLP